MKFEEIRDIIKEFGDFLEVGIRTENYISKNGKRRFYSLQIVNDVFIQDHISVNDNDGDVTVSTLSKELTTKNQVIKFIESIKEKECETAI